MVTYAHKKARIVYLSLHENASYDQLFNIFIYDKNFLNFQPKEFILKTKNFYLFGLLCENGLRE